MNSDDLKRKAAEAAEAAKQFNAKPPMWLYIAIGLAVIIGFQVIRHI